MKKKLVVKHNLKGSFFLGLIISISLIIIFLLPKGFGMAYIKEVSVMTILVPIICIGIYIIWANYYLRKIIVEGEECIYVNMFGRKRKFHLESIGKIVFKDNDNVFIYDDNGIKICKIESNMTNLEEFWEYVYLKKGIIVKCSKDELEYKVDQEYMKFVNYLKSFFEKREKLGIILEYGLRIEERENALFYIMMFRAKNEKGYLGQNFLKIGYWEHKFVFLGYKKDKQMVLYCEEKKMKSCLEKLYRELIWRSKKENIIKKNNLILYEKIQQVNI